MIDSLLLDTIVCPTCHGKLKHDEKNELLICRFEHIAFPVERGIPILLADKAKPYEK
jgi:uncharacterized protein